MLGIVDETLSEEDYDDVVEKKKTFNGSQGWVGITDKYSVNSCNSRKGKFKAEFSTINHLNQIILLLMQQQLM